MRTAESPGTATYRMWICCEVFPEWLACSLRELQGIDIQAKSAQTGSARRANAILGPVGHSRTEAETSLILSPPFDTVRPFNLSTSSRRNKLRDRGLANQVRESGNLLWQSAGEEKHKRQRSSAAGFRCLRAAFILSCRVTLTNQSGNFDLFLSSPLNNTLRMDFYSDFDAYAKERLLSRLKESYRRSEFVTVNPSSE